MSSADAHGEAVSEARAAARAVAVLRARMARIRRVYRQTPVCPSDPATLLGRMVPARARLVLCAAGVGLAVVWAARVPVLAPMGREVRLEPPRAGPLVAPPPVESDAAASTDDARAHDFRVPSGQAPGLTCDAARAIVAQARHQLAYVPDPVDPHAFGEAAADWLDPYGLWSVAPDTPVADAFDAHANGLLADVEARGSTH